MHRSRNSLDLPVNAEKYISPFVILSLYSSKWIWFTLIEKRGRESA